MSRESAPFSWTRTTEEAARLVAEDRQTDERIAAGLGITRRTLARWKAHPEFAERVRANIEAFRLATLRKGIALKERRLAALDDRHKRMIQIIDERGGDPAHAEVPGFTTGLLVHTVKGVGKGEDFRLIDLYEVDTGLLREMREHEKQTAIELGEWDEKAAAESGEGVRVIKERLERAERVRRESQA